MPFTPSPAPDDFPPPPWPTGDGWVEPPDNTGSTASPGGGSPTSSGCPPGYTPSTTPGASPGSCNDAQGRPISPDAFWLYQNVDSSYSVAQWQTWINLGNYDPKTHKFRPERTGPNGEVLDAWVEKPVDCPDNMTASGAGRCVDVGGPSTPGAAAAPVPVGPGKPSSQLGYTGDPLQDALVDMFNYRAGLFGEKDPFLSGVTSRAPKKDDISGMFLPGGGLWWGGENNLSQALAPYAGGFATVPDAPVVPAPTTPTPVRDRGPLPAETGDPLSALFSNPLAPKKKKGPLETAFAQSGLSF